MTNYVNEEKFFEWYESVSKNGIGNRNELLADTLTIFSNTGKSVYTIPAKDTKSGKDESYEYVVDNVGCCGASTIYIYF